MKRSTHIIAMAGAVVMTLCLLVTQSWSAGPVYQTKGEVAAIDLEHNTIVIEVPVKGGQMLTVGGPLSSEASLHKGGKEVKLADFIMGEEVWVKWRLTDKTHVILSLKAV